MLISLICMGSMGGHPMMNNGGDQVTGDLFYLCFSATHILNKKCCTSICALWDENEKSEPDSDFLNGK